MRAFKGFTPRIIETLIQQATSYIAKGIEMGAYKKSVGGDRVARNIIDMLWDLKDQVIDKDIYHG